MWVFSSPGVGRLRRTAASSSPRHIVFVYKYALVPKPWYFVFKFSGFLNSLFLESRLQHRVCVHSVIKVRRPHARAWLIITVITKLQPSFAGLQKATVIMSLLHTQMYVSHGCFFFILPCWSPPRCQVPVNGATLRSQPTEINDNDNDVSYIVTVELINHKSFK